MGHCNIEVPNFDIAVGRTDDSDGRTSRPAAAALCRPASWLARRLGRTDFKICCCCGPACPMTRTEGLPVLWRLLAGPRGPLRPGGDRTTGDSTWPPTTCPTSHPTPTATPPLHTYPAAQRQLHPHPPTEGLSSALLDCSHHFFGHREWHRLDPPPEGRGGACALATWAATGSPYGGLVH